MAPPNKQRERTRPRLTLREVTAIKLAVCAALDDVPAGLSESTLGDLRGADVKLDRALQALARVRVPTRVPNRNTAAAHLEHVAAGEQRDQHGEHR